MRKAEREPLPLGANPQNARFNSRSEYQMQDRIVFVKIAHIFVRPTLDVTVTDIGVFRDIFGWDMTQRFEPVPSVFLREHSRCKYHPRRCATSTGKSTLNRYHWPT